MFWGCFYWKRFGWETGIRPGIPEIGSLCIGVLFGRDVETVVIDPVMDHTGAARRKISGAFGAVGVRCV